MRFEDFVLQFDASSRGGFKARVLRSPFGEGTNAFTLPSPDALATGAFGTSGTFRDLPGAAAPAAGRPPLEVGTELFQSVFRGQVRSLLDKSRGQLEISPDLRLRLKIKIDPTDEETAELADLPWELLCDGDTDDFFALSRQTSLVRYLDVPRSSQPIPFTPPLRILAVSACPDGLQPLDLEDELRFFDELNRSSAGIDVQFLAKASAGTVREALAREEFNVLHFMGHGAFDRASGEGMLAFEAADGSPDLVSGKAFATKLRDLRSLGVVTLNACETARAGGQGGSPFRGVATALVFGGVPAVVAMQKPISDRGAISFSAAFYRHLAKGDSVDEALTEGRQAIHSSDPDGFEWATPVLFLRMPDGHVFVPRPAAAGTGAVAVPAPEPAAPPPLPPSILTEPRPASSGSKGALKIAAGAAGAGLVAVLLYTKVLGPSTAGAPPVDNPQGGMQTSDAQFSTPVRETPADPKPESRKDRQSQRNEPKAQNRISQSLAAIQGSTPPAPGPSKPEPTPQQSEPKPSESAAATADTSSLKANVVSMEPTSKGGVRVVVSFTNTASSRLAVELTPSLSSSGIPYEADSVRLELAAGASAQKTFTFTAPKLGSTDFLFLLSGPDGGVEVEHARRTLVIPQ